MRRTLGGNGGSAGSSLEGGGCGRQSRSCPSAVWGDGGGGDGGGGDGGDAGGWGCAGQGPAPTQSRGLAQNLTRGSVFGSGACASCFHSGSRKRGTPLWV